MKRFIIKMMMATHKGAQHYLEEAVSCTDPEVRRVFKDLALGETAEFDKLYQVYKHKFNNHIESDCWSDYFKDEVHELRTKINELS